MPITNQRLLFKEKFITTNNLKTEKNIERYNKSARQSNLKLKSKINNFRGKNLILIQYNKSAFIVNANSIKKPRWTQKRFVIAKIGSANTKFGQFVKNNKLNKHRIKNREIYILDKDYNKI